MFKFICLLAVLVAVFSNLANAGTWSPAPGGGWESISSSSDGKYIFTTDINGEYGVLQSNNYGSTWTSPGSGLMGVWVKIRASTTGQYVTGLRDTNMYFSKDYGVHLNPSLTSMNDFAMSRSGQYILAPIYKASTPTAVKVSSNYGVTFTDVKGSELPAYRAAGISGSGQYMITSNYTTVMFSDNFGASFSPMKLPVESYWGPFITNYDGQYMLFSSSKGNYISSDYGKSFVACTFPTGKTVFSDKGDVIVVAVPNVGVQISYDYGATWSATNAPAKNWGDITISPDGKRMTACEYRGSIYMSSDFGQTWAQKP